MASTFTLGKGIQVRKEDFGLLFYDSRGPRLYFVPSGDLVKASFFNGNRTVRDIAPHPPGSHRVGQVLEMLEKKGLIHGQSIC